MNCPNCDSPDLALRTPENLVQSLLAALWIHRFRCVSCDKKFWRIQHVRSDEPPSRLSTVLSTIAVIGLLVGLAYIAQIGPFDPGAAPPVVTLRLTGDTIDAFSANLSPPIAVFVDDLSFNSPNEARGKRTIHRGSLSNGQTIAQYFTPGKSVDVKLVGSDGRTIRVTFQVP